MAFELTCIERDVAIFIFERHLYTFEQSLEHMRQISIC